MYNFEEEIRAIEQEILDLKTASEYVSIKNATITTATSVTTGLYQVNYASGDEPILAMAYKGVSDKEGNYSLRTPSGNTQIIEVVTTYWSNADQRYYTDTNSIVLVSNRAVQSIVRL